MKVHSSSACSTCPSTSRRRSASTGRSATWSASRLPGCTSGSSTRVPTGCAAGARIEYSLVLHRFPIRWITQIDEWEPPHRFTDFQVRGPYRLWEHTHTFEPVRRRHADDRRRALRDPLRTTRSSRPRRVRPPRPAPHLRLPPRHGRGTPRRRRRYPCAALPRTPSASPSLAVAAALTASVSDRSATRPANRPAPPTTPNPCTGAHAGRLRCPDIQMGTPANLTLDRYEGRTVLRAGNNLKNRGEGPIMLRGTRSGARTMNARQHIYRQDGSRLVERTGARLFFKYVEGQGHYWKWADAARFELWSLQPDGIAQRARAHRPEGALLPARPAAHEPVEALTARARVPRLQPGRRQARGHARHVGGLVRRLPVAVLPAVDRRHRPARLLRLRASRGPEEPRLGELRGQQRRAAHRAAAVARHARGCPGRSSGTDGSRVRRAAGTQGESPARRYIHASCVGSGRNRQSGSWPRNSNAPPNASASRTWSALASAMP